MTTKGVPVERSVRCRSVTKEEEMVDIVRAIDSFVDLR